MSGAKHVVLLLDASNSGVVLMHRCGEHHVVEVLGIPKRQVRAVRRIGMWRRSGRDALLGEAARILTIGHTVGGWCSDKGRMVGRGMVIVS
jgi:hypothetical protein